MRLLLAAVAAVAACASPESTPQDQPASPAAAPATAEPQATGQPTSPSPGSASAAGANASQAATVIPPIFHGTYDASRDACDGPSEYRLEVSPAALRFHESIGTVRSIAVEGERRILVVGDYQGEGESWSNSRRLELSGDGATLSISGEGTSLVRVRCPAPASR